VQRAARRGWYTAPVVVAAAVAGLAGVSVDYLVRLEQGRAPRPSGEVLAGIAGALRLTIHS